MVVLCRTAGAEGRGWRAEGTPDYSGGDSSGGDSGRTWHRDCVRRWNLLIFKRVLRRITGGDRFRRGARRPGLQAELLRLLKRGKNLVANTYQEPVALVA